MSATHITRTGRTLLANALASAKLTWEHGISDDSKAMWQSFVKTLQEGKSISIAGEDPVERVDCLQQARELVHSARQSTYGHPLDNWTRTAKIWSAILGIEISAEQALLCMIGVKQAREVHSPHPDNLVDIAGYARWVELCINEREVREYNERSNQSLPKG